MKPRGYCGRCYRRCSSSLFSKSLKFSFTLLACVCAADFDSVSLRMLCLYENDRASSAAKATERSWILMKRLRMRLETLTPALGTGFLNLHWILQAMDAMLMSQSELQQLLPNRALRKERKWMSVFLDDNAKLLEVCNIIKQGMSRAGHSRMHVKYVLHLLNVSHQGGSYNEARLLKARKALQECLDSSRSMLGGVKTNEQTGSWLLQDISHGLQVAKNMDAVRKTKIASKVYEANMISVVVLSALLVVLPCEAAGEVPVALQVSEEQQPWASALLQLQQGIKEEAQCRKTKSGGLLEGVYSSLRQVVSLVDSSFSHGRFPLPRGDEAKMEQALQQAAKKFEYVQSCLETMEEQTTALFRKLIVNRNLLLSA